MNSKAKFELVNNPAIKSVKMLEWQSVITLEWQGMSSAGGAANPALFDLIHQNKHRRVNVLDLDIRAVYTRKVEFWSIQEIWEHLCVSPVRLISFKLRFSWMAQSTNAQATHTIKQHKR